MDSVHWSQLLSNNTLGWLSKVKRTPNISEVYFNGWCDVPACMTCVSLVTVFVPHLTYATHKR
jgi:hypothetical protein